MSKEPETSRNSHFYDEKKFRYLTVLVANMNNLFSKKTKKPKKGACSSQGKSKDANRFSMDEYLETKRIKQRKIYGVLFLPDFQEILRKR